MEDDSAKGYKFGDRALQAMERMREQRVKQIASRIVEAALGVRAYASRLPQSCAATQDFFEKIAVERCGEALLGDAQLGGVSL